MITERFSYLKPNERDIADAIMAGFGSKTRGNDFDSGVMAKVVGQTVTLSEIPLNTHLGGAIVSMGGEERTLGKIQQLHAEPHHVTNLELALRFGLENYRSEISRNGYDNPLLQIKARLGDRFEQDGITYEDRRINAILTDNDRGTEHLDALIADLESYPSEQLKRVYNSCLVAQNSFPAQVRRCDAAGAIPILLGTTEVQTQAEAGFMFQFNTPAEARDFYRRCTVAFKAIQGADAQSERAVALAEHISDISLLTLPGAANRYAVYITDATALQLANAMAKQTDIATALGNPAAIAAPRIAIAESAARG